MPVLEKKKQENTALIRVDKVTYRRLKKLANGIPVARYLRELSVSPIQNKLSELATTIDALKSSFFMEYQKKSGEFVQIDSSIIASGEDIPVIAEVMIRQAIDKDPDVKEMGDYYRGDDGLWRVDMRKTSATLRRIKKERDVMLSVLGGKPARGV